MKYKDKVAARICDHVRSRYDIATVIPEQGLFNYRCFHNAVEYARVNDYSVLEVISIDDGVPILHYVNKDKDTGELYETTLGYRSEYLEYYVIREINEDDYKYIGAEFDRSLRSWLDQFTNAFERFIFSIKRVV